MMPGPNDAREEQIVAASRPKLAICRLAGLWWDDHWITPVLGYRIRAAGSPSSVHIIGWNPSLPNLENNRILVRAQGRSHQSPPLAAGEKFSLDIPLDPTMKDFQLLIAALYQLEEDENDRRMRACHLYQISLV
jgi:hypothetical protein